MGELNIFAESTLEKDNAQDDFRFLALLVPYDHILGKGKSNGTRNFFSGKTQFILTTVI